MSHYTIFTGIDGAGKTTVLKELKKHFPDYLFTFEPNSEWYKNRVAKSNSPMEKALLFTADRVRHLQSTVIPALNSNTNVIQDRGHYCNIAYQAAEMFQYDQGTLNLMIRYTGTIQPEIPKHRVVHFDCPAHVAYMRKTEFNPQFLQKVNEVYDAILPADAVKIDATRPVEEIVDELVKIL